MRILIVGATGTIGRPWVTETLIALEMDPTNGMPAVEVATAYVESIEGKRTGAVISPGAKS